MKKIEVKYFDKYTKLIKYLSNFGFEISRTSSSHYILKHPSGVTTIVPAQNQMHMGLCLGIQRRAFRALNLM